jgi:hypothetical protein
MKFEPALMETHCLPRSWMRHLKKRMPGELCCIVFLTE